MAPGVICYLPSLNDKCYMNHVPVLRYSFLFTALVYGYFIADLAVMLAMLIVRRTPILGTQFLYFISNIGRPLTYALTTAIVQSAWAVIWAFPFTGRDTEQAQYQF